MADQMSTFESFEKRLLENLDPSNSPANVLLSLSSPGFAPESYTKVDQEPLLIFLCYMRFIMRRQPEGCVDGIWEKILWKIIKHSRYITGIGTLLFDINHLRGTYDPKNEIWVDQMKIWLHRALSTHSNCPNPYIRLELFRLLTMVDRKMDRKCLNKTFINTICEINPHRLYLGYEEHDLLFSLENFSCIIKHNCRKLVRIMRSGHYEDVIWDDFLSRSLQLIGVCTHMGDYYPGEVLDHLLYDSTEPVFKAGGFKNLVSSSPVRPFLVEAVREYTAAAVNNENINERDEVVADLDVCFSDRDLPRLLLLRQVHGPREVYHYSLLLKELDLVG